MKINKLLLIAAMVVYGLVLTFNDGIMALDEYFVGITRYIPAQTSSIQTLVHSDDVKSPLQLMPMHGAAQLALKLGIEHPYHQYRFVLTLLGLINVLLLGFVFAKYFKENTIEKSVLLFLFVFYFVGPFAFTRTMFESMAAPWLGLTALFGSRYDRNGKLTDLLIATTAVSVAFMLRQQVGICALALGVLPLLKKRWKDFSAVAALGLFWFLLSGIPDSLLRGEFHYSLKAILFYNVAHGADYATHPISTYPLLIFALALGPWWLMKYPTGFWSEHFKQYKTEWMMLILFVVLHSAFPQKWERFLISMIPVMLILLTPLVTLLWQQRAQRKMRLVSLTLVNLFLFVPASFFPPQKNLINLSLYLDSHPEVTELIKVEDIPGWFTDRFIRSINYETVRISRAELKDMKPISCGSLLVVPQFWAQEASQNDWVLDESLSVNLIESIAYKLNPEKNARRAPLALMRAKTGCL